MIASLVRPMAVTKSGCGGGNGAAPMPSTTRSSGKPSSNALCNATSSTRATTWVPPARLCVGAKMIVNRFESTPQSLATFATTGGVAELLEQRLAARQCARRPGAEREEGVLAFAVRELPARILAGEAGDHRIGRARHQRPRPARRQRRGNEIDLAEPAHA